jgi:hypothetical protein
MAAPPGKKPDASFSVSPTPITPSTRTRAVEAMARFSQAVNSNHFMMIGTSLPEREIL